MVDAEAEYKATVNRVRESLQYFVQENDAAMSNPNPNLRNGPAMNFHQLILDNRKMLNNLELKSKIVFDILDAVLTITNSLISDGMDPLAAKKVADIKRNLHLVRV